MAQLKGARIAVNAPNSDTNRILTAPGIQSACMKAASRIAAVAYSETARDTKMSMTEKKRRYPVVSSMAIAARFRGTIRSGAAVKGQQYGMRASTVEKVMNDIG